MSDGQNQKKTHEYIEELNERRLGLLARKYKSTGSELSSTEEKILEELHEIIVREMPSVTCKEWWNLNEIRFKEMERRIRYLETKHSVMR